METKFDIGLFGVWSQCSYGTIISYYALNRSLNDLGASVLMIDRPVGGEESKMTYARRFAYDHNYNMASQLSGETFWKFNNSCDKFMTGSDQLWNYALSSRWGHMYYLDFAADTKKKISYATSFGHKVDFTPKEKQKLLEGYFRRFNSLSVREDDGVKILKENYNVNAEQVIDPVFLCSSDIYKNLAEESNIIIPQKYILSYIINPNKEKISIVKTISQIIGDVEMVSIVDERLHKFEDKEKNHGLEFENEKVKEIETTDWVKYIINSEFVVTDSYHAMCLAMIFNKPFIAIPNRSGGFSRFDSIGRLLKIESHFANSPEDILKNPEMLAPFDYSKISKKISDEKTRCIKWLSDAISN